MNFKVYASSKFGNKEFNVICERVNVENGVYYFFMKDKPVAILSIPVDEAVIVQI